MQILQLLAQEPWLTPEQIVRWHVRGASRVHADLNHLLQAKMVQRVNPRSGWISARAVFGLTDRGVDVLASQQNVDVTTYRRRNGISRARHTLLLWRLERVWNVRNLLLALDRSEYHVKMLKTEVDECYAVKEQHGILHVHGRGMLAHDDSWFLPFLVEWDAWNEPTDRKRLARFNRWLKDARFHTFGFEKNLPILLIVAADAWRLHEIWDVYVSAPREYGAVAPPMYLTTAQLLRTRGANDAIWFSSETHEWGQVFSDARWQEHEPKVFLSSQPTQASKIGAYQEKTIADNAKLTAAHLLQWKLALSPVAKRVLHWVLRYPLLSADEIAWVGDETRWRVQKELKTVAENGLVTSHEHEAARYFVITPNGWRYATAEAGQGRALRRFMKRRGSVRNVRRLVFHFAHTRATNVFFLKWKALARERGAYFECRAESECAVYFRWEGKLHAWLPDGMGIWMEKDRSFVFVVEMDRTRESSKNLSKKFLEYYLWEEWKASERIPGVVPEVLLITTSWQRAARVRTLFDASRLRPAFEPLSLWMTTFEAMEREGIAGAIWRHNADWENVTRLPCFDPPCTPSL